MADRLLKGAKLIAHRSISMALPHVYMRFVPRANVGHVEEEFDGAPVVEIKVKTILRMLGKHLRGGAAGREAPP